MKQRVLYTKPAKAIEEGDDLLMALTPNGPMGAATVLSRERFHNELVNRWQIELRVAPDRAVVLDADAEVVVLG